MKAPAFLDILSAVCISVLITLLTFSSAETHQELVTQSPKLYSPTLSLYVY
uniref:Uncharacterized protein n=1 Tax=Kalanchoe fedtschenkoi TaxID=63787 RepID=A0A7N1A6X8_KALFE